MEDTDPIVPGEAGATAESEAEKRRQKWRERKRKQRAEARDQKAAEITESKAEWFSRNRAKLSPDELAEMQAQDARCLDHVLVMNYMDANCLTDDPAELGITLGGLNEIFERDCVADLVTLVKENGVTHLGYIHRSDEIPQDWPSRPFWKDAELLAALEQEGLQTGQYIRYGLLAALPDWQVAHFLQDHAKWPWDEVAALLGYYENAQGIVRHR